MPLEVIFEDNHLLVLFKPPNLPTQPSLHHADSLETRGKAYLKEKYHKPGNVYLHAIHRLDATVSGVVVFAKTSKSLSRLQASIRNKDTQKIYFAIVEGNLKSDSGTLEHWLSHADFRALESHPQDPQGKRCKLTYEVIKRDSKTTTVKIELQTGRYHQIRAQFALIGHPILGDVKYGSKLPFSKQGIALHHASFSIKHPISGELLTFQAPFASSFMESLELTFNSKINIIKIKVE